MHTKKGQYGVVEFVEHPEAWLIEREEREDRVRKLKIGSELDLTRCYATRFQFYPIGTTRDPSKSQCQWIERSF